MQAELSHRSFTLEREQIDAAARTVPASLSSEEPYERHGEIEVLSHDPAAIDLARAKDGLPLLFAHSHDLPIGVVERVRIEGRKLHGVLRFGKSAKADEVFADVQAGILRNMSIGYRVNAAAPIDGGYMATRWQPFEASIVSVAADPTVGIGRRSLLSNHTSTQGKNMTATLNPPDPTIETRAVVDAEIRSLAKRHGMTDAFADDLIARSTNADQARGAILEFLAERDSVGTRSRAPRPIDFGYDGNAPEIYVRGMAEVLSYRYGGPAPSEQARQFAGLRLADMARQLLELRGIRTTRLGGAEIIERALHTTSDFPALLADTGNRLLRQAYGSYAGGIRRIAKQSTAVDFRAKSKVQLSEAPSLKAVNEHGEFTHGSMAESKQSYSLGTYGRIFGITRQALVNDDLGAFADMTARFGRASVEFESQFLVDLVASNPVLDDGVALFHASHGNLAGSGAAISVASLGLARQALRLQKGLDSVTPIDVTPRYLVVPAALETVAEQYLANLWASEAAKANPFSGILELVVDPRLDAKSTTAWYVAADPATIDTIEYAYLESAQGPEIELRPGFEVDGVEIKCRLDYGAGVLDHRGLYRNPGA